VEAQFEKPSAEELAELLERDLEEGSATVGISAAT